MSYTNHVHESLLIYALLKWGLLWDDFMFIVIIKGLEIIHRKRVIDKNNDNWTLERVIDYIHRIVKMFYNYVK